MADLRVDNTRVCVRLRKSNQSNKEPASEQKKCLTATETDVTVYTNVGEYPFVCDRVFDEETPQIDVFRYCGLPLLEDVLAGYNATMIACMNPSLPLTPNVHQRLINIIQSQQ